MEINLKLDTMNAKNYYIRITYVLKDEFEYEGVFKEHYAGQLIDELQSAQRGEDVFTFSEPNGEGVFSLSGEIMKHTEVYYTEIAQ